MMPEADRRACEARLEQLRAEQPLRCNPEWDRASLMALNRDATAK
jgi:hypothetical protein